MRSPTAFSVILAATWLVSPTTAQTYTQCDPLTSGNCPPNTALGKSVNINFASGPSDSFTSQGKPTYDSNGASFTINEDSLGAPPQLTSKWYIMFGHVDFVVKAAPGAGIISSCVLQSDTRDEIDWEWRGSDNSQVQTNYFGKGLTTSYNRGADHPDPGNQDGFKTYSIDWTADQIVWSIDGKNVRALSSSTADQYPYPQTPMMIKVGSWCGGCSSNNPGTIEWAGGAPNFQNGPFTMQVKSISVTDYSTGSQYKYTGSDGTWQSITAVGGSVNPKGGKGSSAGAAAPEVSASSNSGPMPFPGTHSDGSTTMVQPNAGGWTPTTMQTSGVPTVTTYPGLPEGWTVTSEGKVLPPSAASVTSQPTSPSSSPEDSQQPSPTDGYEVLTTYNQQGFPVVATQAESEATAVKHYDDRGFLIPNGPILVTRASPTADDQRPASSIAQAAAAVLESSSALPISKHTTAPTNVGFRSGQCGISLAILFGGLVGLFLL
ncbi:MAG: hypothetical protein Q9163_003878 [Psora crenata]